MNIPGPTRQLHSIAVCYDCSVRVGVLRPAIGDGAVDNQSCSDPKLWYFDNIILVAY